MSIPADLKYTKDQVEIDTFINHTPQFTYQESKTQISYLGGYTGLGVNGSILLQSLESYEQLLDLSQFVESKNIQTQLVQITLQPKEIRI